MNILTITGCSGSGKNFLVDKIQESLNKENIDNEFIVSYTTRQIRNGEINGKDYYFITREEFEEKIKNNELLEYVEVNGNYYGTPLYQSDKLYLHIVDPKGVKNLKQDNRIFTKHIFLKDNSEGELLIQRIQDRINNSLNEKEKESHIKRIEHLKNVEIIDWNNDKNINKFYDKVISIQEISNKEGLDSEIKDIISFIKKEFYKNKLKDEIEEEINKGKELLKKMTPFKLIKMNNEI